MKQALISLLILFFATSTAFAAISDPDDVPDGDTDTYTDETLYIETETWVIAGTVYLENTDVYINNYEMIVQAGGRVVLSRGSKIIGNGNTPDLWLGDSHVIEGSGYFYNLNILVPNGDWQILDGDMFLFEHGGSIEGGGTATIYVQGDVYFYGAEREYYFEGWDQIVGYDDGVIYLSSSMGSTILDNVPDIRQWGTGTALQSSGSNNRNEINMRGGESIRINGYLICSQTNFNGYNGGQWNGISYVNSSSYSSLTSCRLEGVDMTNAPAIVYLYNCGDNHTMGYCHFVGDDVTGKAVRVYAGAGYTTELNMYCCDVEDGWYGVTVDGAEAYLSIRNSLIHDNVTGVICGNGGHAYIEESCIDDNLSHGLSVNGGSDMEVLDCTLDGNANVTSGVLYATGSGSMIKNYSSAYYRNTFIGSNVMAYATSGATISMPYCYWSSYPPSVNDGGGTGTIDYSNPAISAGSDLCSCAMGLPKTPAELVHDINNPDIVDAYCYPNPFNPTTTITYKIAEDVPVTLNVYTMTGELVQTLVDETQHAGTYSVTFDVANKLSSGVYFYELSTPIGSRLGKMILQK